MGIALRLADALAAPHGIDRYLELVNPMWAARDVRARVVSIHRENPDSAGAPVATLTLQPTSTWRGHRAGQHLLVGADLPGSGRRVTRAFSISSAASAPGERFTLTIRAHEEGRLSKYLVTEAQPGQVLHLSQAQGEFGLTESPATPTNNRLVFITGGSGITPAMSMLRTLLRDGYDGHAGRKVVFLHYARSPEDQIFAEELARIAEAPNGVDVHLRYGEQQFTEFELRRLVPDHLESDAWLCGPVGLVELVTAAYALPDGGTSPRLRTEFFKPAVARAAAGADDVPEGEVTFARSGRTAPATATSLLEQAEAAGLSPEYGCRMGICMSCTSRKTSGVVRNVLNGEESDASEEDIRLCVSQPVGDCTIEI